ncbi:MAG: class I SAM-dependent methyltransferase [Acidobacteria bacterium]|nr:class I SAM-dependent methyltransferase [Acidobacteriota bacterium]
MMDTQQRKIATTADLVAAARARHQRDRVRLLDDPYALALTSPSLRRVLRFRPAAWFLANWTLRGLKPVILGLLIRARYAERAVEAAFRDGIRQYVVVGAGLDSFALRRTDLVPPLEVFEIDRPAMQELKRERIRSAGISSPPGHHFVPADLEQVSVMEALSNAPFDPEDPAILSFLGVTYYLSPETLAESARSIASGVAPGSRLVVDYMLDEASAWPEHRKMRAQLEAYVAKRGEPMKSEYSLAAMSELLAEAGFRPLEAVTMMDLADRYAEELGPLPFETPGLFACGLFGK